MNFKQTAAFIFAGIICMIGGAHAQTVITIGTSAKADHPFSAMDSLLTEITNGNLKGDITLALENGDYTMTKNFILNTAKFTGNDRLTITSKTGMRDSVRLHTSLSGAGAFQLTNARQVTVRNLTIESASNYNCFCFTSACAHVEIRNCVLLTPHNITNAKNSSIGNNATGFTLNDIRIVGNRIAGSQSNIKLTGSSTQRFHNIVVDSNDCSQAYDRGISIEFTDTLRIAHNTIRPRPYCSSSHYGLYASNNNAAEIIGNHLNMPGTTT